MKSPTLLKIHFSFFIEYAYNKKRGEVYLLVTPLNLKQNEIYNKLK